MDNQTRLELMCSIIETFEDFLEEKGIVIPNDEKEQSPDSASNIYGTDYGNLSDDIENILMAYGLFEEHDSEVTVESVTKIDDGSHILIDRYGVNDYSVWFTDDPKDNTSGCSTRGTLMDIFDELKGVLNND